MRVIVCGDSAAGKTTFLDALRPGSYRLHRETLLPRLPRQVYDDIVLRRLSFAAYFLERDLPTWPDTATTFYEHFAHVGRAFTLANRRAGELSGADAELVLKALDRAAAFLPLDSDDVALHFTCDAETVNKRIAARAVYQKPKSAAYLTALRDELRHIFAGHCRYYRIDTSECSPQEVQAKIQREALPWIQFAWTSGIPGA